MAETMEKKNSGVEMLTWVGIIGMFVFGFWLGSLTTDNIVEKNVYLWNDTSVTCYKQCDSSPYAGVPRNECRIICPLDSSSDYWRN